MLHGYRLQLIHSGWVLHAGRIEDINDIDCYIVTPSVIYPKGQVVLVLTNVFGAKYIKNQVRRFQRRLDDIGQPV